MFIKIEKNNTWAFQPVVMQAEKTLSGADVQWQGCWWIGEEDGSHGVRQVGIVPNIRKTSGRSRDLALQTNSEAP